MKRHPRRLSIAGAITLVIAAAGTLPSAGVATASDQPSATTGYIYAQESPHTKVMEGSISFSFTVTCTPGSVLAGDAYNEQRVYLASNGESYTNVEKQFFEPVGGIDGATGRYTAAKVYVYNSGALDGKVAYATLPCEWV